MRANVRRLLWQLRRRNNQKGFTLIELLVVISILGILAAVVTMSMVGITRIAQDRAAATELQTVQVAYDTMLSDQGVPANSVSNLTCDGAPPDAGHALDAMDKFPQAKSVTFDVNGKPIPSHDTVALYPNYLRQPTTHGTYYCTGSGEIKQASYTP